LQRNNRWSASCARTPDVAAQGQTTGRDMEPPCLSGISDRLAWVKK
jgi:hypothetical protein